MHIIIDDTPHPITKAQAVDALLNDPRDWTNKWTRQQATVLVFIQFSDEEELRQDYPDADNEFDPDLISTAWVAESMDQIRNYWNCGTDLQINTEKFDELCGAESVDEFVECLNRHFCRAYVTGEPNMIIHTSM